MNSESFDRVLGTGVVADGIYRGLVAYQTGHFWYGQGFFRAVHKVVDSMIVDFKFDVQKYVLRFDALPVKVMAHYRPSHNGFGLEGEIAINTVGLEKLVFWQVLALICHQLIHAWQHYHGTPARRDHHNLEFRRKAAELGLLVDRQGTTDYLLQSPFMDLLKTHGIDVPTEAGEATDADEAGGRLIRGLDAPAGRPKGKSTLHKWKCQCSSVRSGRSDLQMICMKCGHYLARDPAQA